MASTDPESPPISDVPLPSDHHGSAPPLPPPADRGLAEGVAEGAGPDLIGPDSDVPYPWTSEMLEWQRTGFHFQPEMNWMNDPNGPLYYKGWYHFFYQYNPSAATWGNISWGHAVSEDLLHWKHLPLAMEPDRWYDQKGVLTGSATLLNDSIVMLYTGLTNKDVQVQNLAVPADPSDPLLLNWTKADHVNPVLEPPSGIGNLDFRDPSTAWFESSDSTWRFAIGAKDASHNGIAMVYSTKDFLSYTRLDNLLHSVDGAGGWECIDFYPITTSGPIANRGLDTSVRPGQQVKHVLKASPEDYQCDCYSIGTYEPTANKWVPDDESLDVGIGGLKYDYGKFYAGKTFYDPDKGRRVLWGWIPEADSQSAQLAKGWASIQSIPRTVLFDMKTGSNLLVWPVEEVEKLRFDLRDYSGLTIEPGSTLPLSVSGGAQLDIEAEFLINAVAPLEADGPYDCATSGGSANRGMLGPFGLLVLANDDLTEQTATYFYVSKGTDGSVRTHFCQDELRSSKASDTVKSVVGHTVPVLDGETLSLRILVDHSVVESFAQGGRACATSRVYPTEAIYDSARVFLFNNATGTSVTSKTLKIWHMHSTFNQQFDFNRL